MTSDAAFHVRGLEKSYRELPVLRGVGFVVAYSLAMATYRRRISWSPALPRRESGAR